MNTTIGGWDSPFDTARLYANWNSSEVFPLHNNQRTSTRNLIKAMPRLQSKKKCKNFVWCRRGTRRKAGESFGYRPTRRTGEESDAGTRVGGGRFVLASVEEEEALHLLRHRLDSLLFKHLQTHRFIHVKYVLKI